MVQGERELQAVDPRRFQTDPRRTGTFGRPTNEFLVSSRGVRKPRQRQPFPSALHHAHQRFRIYIDPDLIDLFRRRGFTFTTLPDAMKDPAYSEDPDLALKYGGDFQGQIAAARHVKFPQNSKPYKELEATCR